MALLKDYFWEESIEILFWVHFRLYYSTLEFITVLMFFFQEFVRKQAKESTK